MQVGFSEPTVDRINFREIFDGIKFESSVQDSN